LEVLDYYADVVFQDRGTDTGDLAPMVDAGTDT
jgi:hypothetical protein